MYYADLSTYSYRLRDSVPGALNVGWLDGEHEFTTGEPPAGFTERLLLFCRRKVKRTRGLHYCEICPREAAGPVRVPFGEELVVLGSAEMRVLGEDGKVYAAPDLIYHYVTEHNYLPPQEFVEAVFSTPLPGTEEYEDWLADIGVR